MQLNHHESYYTEPIKPINQFGDTQCISDILAGRISITDVPPEFRQYTEEQMIRLLSAFGATR